MSDLDLYNLVKGELINRGVDADQIEQEARSPFAPLRKVETIRGKRFTDFPFPIKSPTSFIPEGLVKPLYEGAGAGLGFNIPIPFAATALSSLGNMAAQEELRQRKILQEEEPPPFIPSEVGKTARNTLLFSAGVKAFKTVPKIIPFLTSMRKGFSTAFGEEEVIPAVQGIRKAAVQKFGESLKSMDPNTQIDGSDLLRVFFKTEGNVGVAGAPIASTVKLERVGERDFINGLVERFRLGNPSLNASETQQLANIFDRKPATEHLADLAREKLLDANPEVVPFMRKSYAQKIGDYNALKNVLKIDPEDRIGLTERMADVAFNPEFKAILQRNQLGNLIPKFKGMGTVEGFKNFLRYGGRTLQRAAIFRSIPRSR